MPRLLLAALGGLVILSAVACTDAAAGQAQGKGQPGPEAVAVQPSTPPAAADGSLTPAQVVTAAEQSFPEMQPYAIYGSCDSAGRLAACPFTARLVARLADLKQPLIRAQNGSTTREVTAEMTGRATGIAHVTLFNGREHIDLTVVQSGTRVLVDDSTCTGQAGTSIYDAFVACN